MEQSSQLKCSICYNASHGPTCTSCSDIFTNVITSLTTKPQNPFSDIENLVFQGGGVKGAAYLGVLQQLESESTGFLKRVKRVAGSSAGSIVALYLALNLDLKKIESLVIDEKYIKLLDDGIPLIVDGENITVRAKTVFLAAIEYFKILKGEAHDPDKSKEALKKIRKIGQDIRDYLVRDRRFYEVYFFNKVIGEKGAEAITSWILDLLDVSYVAEGIENISEKDKEKRDKMAGMVKDEIKKGFKDVPENQINHPPRASAPQARASLQIEVKELSVVRERRNDVVYVKESVKKSCLVVEELKRPRMDLGVGSIMDSEKKELNVVKEGRNEVYMKESVQKSCLAEEDLRSRPRMGLGVGSLLDSEKKELSVVKEGRNEVYIKESVQKSCHADENLISQPGMGWGIKSIIGSLKSYRRNFLDKYLFEQGNRPGARYKFNLSDPDDIKLLHYSLAELLKQMKVYGDEEVEYKYNKDKIQPKEDKEETDKRLNIQREDTKKDPLGVFTGNYVKYKLIIEPIASMVGKDKFGDNGPTFADLASVTKNGKKVFKDLYITAFNSGTNRTEVFSAEHTPHAFVADAVRASMSIPGFFKPVNILQKNGDKVENRKIFYEKNNETTSEDVLFMDGGILDNYPLWIFDDIKYLIPNISLNAQGEEARRHRFTIQNPRTLGFKLLDPKTLARYTEPYIDNDLSQTKRTNETSQKNGSKLSFAFGSLFGGKSDQEENEFIKFGNCPRTVYVDNADVSAVAFDMDEKVVTKLINNGKKSVTEYGKRYGRSFVNEGQAYPAYSC